MRGVAYTYGALARTARRSAGMTLAETAARVGCSVSYLSDVEHGTRLPFASDRTVRLASALNTDPMPLLLAGARERGCVEVESDDDRIVEAACRLVLSR